MRRRSLRSSLILLTSLALEVATSLQAGLAAPVTLGVALPQSGIDGAAALQLRDAMRLAADDLRSRGIEVVLRAPDMRGSAVRNPHQDEGTDNGADVAGAPRLVSALYRAQVASILGPLRTNVAVAMIPDLRLLHLTAISATAAGPSPPDSPVFHLTPSEMQLATAAYARMKKSFGPRACVLDDGTAVGRAQAHAFMAIDPSALHASVTSLWGRTYYNHSCVVASDGVYVAAQGTEPVFCKTSSARLMLVNRLVVAMSHRDFNPKSFTWAGALYRALPRPIARTPQIDTLANRYHDRARVRAGDDALRAYASVEIAAAAIAAAQNSASGSIAQILRTRAFPTAIGTFRFNAHGEPANAAIQVVTL